MQDPDYAGAISVAGDMNYEAYEAHDAQTFDPVTNLYWPFTAFGIKASYPAFDVARMLTPRVLARYRDVITKGCWYYAYAALKEIGRQRAVKHDWAIAALTASQRDHNVPVSRRPRYAAIVSLFATCRTPGAFQAASRASRVATNW